MIKRTVHALRTTPHTPLKIRFYSGKINPSQHTIPIHHNPITRGIPRNQNTPPPTQRVANTNNFIVKDFHMIPKVLVHFHQP